MVASQIHLVRHGEVFNPDRVLYGRLPGFGLSERGHKMAAAAANDLLARDRKYGTLIASPLQRTQESAAPVAALLGLTLVLDERVIEPHNHFEGKQMRRAVLNPANWPALRDPNLPSWGEPYGSIVTRMMAAIEHAWKTTASGDAVIVSHQLPIWMVHRYLADEALRHDPRKRRCALSSITTLERVGDRFVEVDYRDPAASLAAGSLDVGAV
ncbi:histidine phosphatase family protein [Mycetocola tolaasinivorans]|uniref:Histidine phosphatase family protein n=1 Tax=Mycetocola tolaasinivorans TaxID=76635 RepID=A0A3L7A6B0_9MICO|nr:histidine phosphatase family protein [Mycetocola tolaasinivorans]RLP75664.1 histidine phosphatase family protein [Mycetocola tolaasinivorans]